MTWLLAALVGLVAIASPPSALTGTPRFPSVAWPTRGEDRTTHTLQVRYLMGTVFTIEAEGPHAFEATDQAFQLLHHLDATLSTYRPDSELSQVNHRAGLGWTRVSADTATVVNDALREAAESHGAFDPTVGPLVALWGFKYLDYRIPSATQIAQTRARVGYLGAHVDAQRSAIKLDRPGMELDLGAIGKGFTVDRAVALLKSLGMTSIRVDAGGNQGVWSAHPQTWFFGIKHPRSEGDILGAVRMPPGGVSTAGDAVRGFWHHGVRYGHHLDPATGRPVLGTAAVTVVAPSAEEADALSTTLTVLGRVRGLQLLTHHPGCAALFVEEGRQQGHFRFTATPGLDWHPTAESFQLRSSS